MPGAVIKKWQEIWDNELELNENIPADFEVYARSKSPRYGNEVDIYVAVI